MLFPELSEKLIACFYDVHKHTRYGYLESLYQRCYLIALEEQGIQGESEVPITVFFRERPVGNYRLDIIVERKVIIECKNCPRILPVHKAQLLHYLRATRLPLGFLLNFGPEASFARVVNERGMKSPGQIAYRRRTTRG